MNCFVSDTYTAGHRCLVIFSAHLKELLQQKNIRCVTLISEDQRIWPLSRVNLFHITYTVKTTYFVLDQLYIELKKESLFTTTSIPLIFIIDKSQELNLLYSIALLISFSFLSKTYQ